MASSPSSPGNIEKKFDILINSLRSVIEISQNQSTELYTKVNTLYEFQPNGELGEKQEVPTTKTNGVMTKMTDMINELSRINSRNRDILNHFDGLV